MKWLWIFLVLTQTARGGAELWDLPPLRYSETLATDPVAKLAGEIAAGTRKVEGTTGLDRLRFVLKEMKISEESQVLVFSKTSFQNPLIDPKNPRALYFSMDAYVGYVPGGAIEVIVQDPVLGVVFYVIDTDESGELKIVRDSGQCISCHGSASTEHVPGLQVRSVFSDAEGRPLLAMGTNQVNHETPLAERWGSYYVTGRSSLPHLGNRTYGKDVSAKPMPSDLEKLAGVIDVSKYPQPTSDVVALMVLEHQCRMHNLLNAASLQYRRASYLARALDAAADVDSGSPGRVADSVAGKIVDCLFFKDEADPGEGIEGGETFQKTFSNSYPRTRDGKSLADFQLYDRLFKRRCSFMVYSSAFTNLPPRVKSAVFAKMKLALAGDGLVCPWLKVSERKHIALILAETLPGWN